VSGERINPYWFGPTIAILVPLAMAPIGAWLRLLEPDTALMLVGMAAFFALVAAVLLPGAAAFATVTDRPWRRGAVRGAVVPVLLVLGALLYLSTSSTPSINEVSTDWVDRPRFPGEEAPPEDQAAAAAHRLEYLGEVQREAYPDLKAILLTDSPARAHERALAAAQAMPRWRVEQAQPESLQIQVSVTSRVFGFVDDVAIRVRPAEAGSRIDMRSRSRHMKADFGANAAHLRAFREALLGEKD
jgi:uncharacterized protein (DUF1499 family)